MDDNDNSVDGGLEDEGLCAPIIPQIIFQGTNIYVVDDFIDNDKKPTGLGDANPQQHLSWSQFPDREKDGFQQFLTELLEQSVNPGGRNLAL